MKLCNIPREQLSPGRVMVNTPWQTILVLERSNNELDFDRLYREELIRDEASSLEPNYLMSLEPNYEVDKKYFFILKCFAPATRNKIIYLHLAADTGYDLKGELL